MTFSSVMDHHLFADDMQGHCSGWLDDVTEIVSWLESCIIDICTWCGAKRLQLSADKTGLMWFGPASQLHRLPSHNNSINVNQCVVKPLTVVRDLGVWFDAELSLRSHVSRVVQTWFLPRCMQCRRGLAMRILSVRLSVRLSVCHTHVLWQNGRKICPDFYTIRKNI